MSGHHASAAGPGRAAAMAVEARIPVATAVAMRSLGARLAALLRPGDLVVLTGPLGAGKTTLVQGIGDGLRVRGPVTSPTFVIARTHPALHGGPALVHADAYRLGSRAEVDDLDLDAGTDHSVTVVEWGEGLADQLADSLLQITITMAGQPSPGTARPPGTAPAVPGTAAKDTAVNDRAVNDRAVNDRAVDSAANDRAVNDRAVDSAANDSPDEPRLVHITARGDRWASAADSLHSLKNPAL